MKLIILFLLYFLNHSTSFGQEIGALKKEKALLAYATTNELPYSFSTEGSLRLLKVSYVGCDATYKFNANGICFHSGFVFTSDTLRAKFEKKLTANYELTFDSTYKEWKWVSTNKERRISISKMEAVLGTIYSCFVIFFK